MRLAMRAISTQATYTASLGSGANRRNGGTKCRI